MLVAAVCLRPKSSDHKTQPKAYCQCWDKKFPVLWPLSNGCTCGEDNNNKEWGWEPHVSNGSSWVVVSEDRKQVTFHPFYSSGTAVAKADRPLLHNYHYYWEVKILTETYGTDVMVGVGTNKVNTEDCQFKFTSLLGQDGESYGLSYKGAVRHNAICSRDSIGFCCGSIVGVRVDMWRGTLEFYINRKPQGVSFYNLRRHLALYPMVCSTAAQSSMRLIYAASWRASLLVDAAKILAATSKNESKARFPPGLEYLYRSQFWLTLPTGGDDHEEDYNDVDAVDIEALATSVNLTSSLKRRYWQMSSQTRVTSQHQAQNI